MNPGDLLEAHYYEDYPEAWKVFCKSWTSYCKVMKRELDKTETSRGWYWFLEGWLEADGE